MRIQNHLQVAPYIEKLKPYIAGKPIEETQREYGVKKVYKLASNENPLGASPKALKAIQKEFKTLELYPDASGYSLRTKLAKLNKVSFDEIVLGNGSNEIIELILKSICVPGDLMVASFGVFAAYPISARIQGVDTLFAPMTQDFRADLNAMLELIKKNDRVKIVALPNPNNPTGTYQLTKEMMSFLNEVEKIRQGSVHVMLDYAYWEYVTAKDLPDPIKLYKKFSNISILKTFSKIYGLGGLRVGYGVMSKELASYVQKVRMPFNVSRLGLVGAEAALDDLAFVKKTLKVNQAGMKQMSSFYTKHSIPFLPSQGNFYLINTQEGLGLSGQETFEFSLKEGLIFRPVTNYGLPDWLRVTIGTKTQNEAAINVFKKIISKRGRTS